MGIVGIGIDRYARLRREAQGEEAPQPSGVRSAAGFHISQPSNLILSFERHIHHETSVIHFSSHHLAHFALLVVELDILHRICGQVVEHDVVVAFEEILPVEQQALHLFPVDEDSSVALQPRPRELPHQCVEHGTFRQIESVGVVYERVAPRIEFNFRGCHGGLSQNFFGGFPP